MAILAVIAIHTEPFKGEAYPLNGAFMNAGQLINQLARFAVPFFFVIAGYFWGGKIREGQPLYKTSMAMAKRIALLFLFWVVIYIPQYNVLPVIWSVSDYGWLGPIKISYWHFRDLVTKDTQRFLLEGTSTHLWFLESLLWALLITTLSFRHKRVLVGICVALYVFGVLGQTYSATPWGLNLVSETRDGPFFGTAFFVAGYFLSGLQPNQTWLWKGGLCVLFGTALHFLELYICWHAYGIAANSNYLFGTFFMGLGTALAALSNHKIFRCNKLAFMGKYTLGIYAVHIIFLHWLSYLGSTFHSAVWEISRVFLIFGLSFLTVYLLSKNRWARKVVM